MKLHNFKVLDREAQPLSFDGFDWESWKLLDVYQGKINLILRWLFCSCSSSDWVKEAAKISHQQWILPLTVMIPWHEDDPERFSFSRYRSRTLQSIDEILPTIESVENVISHSSGFSGYSDLILGDKIRNIHTFAPAAVLGDIWRNEIAHNIARRYLGWKNGTSLDHVEIQKDIEGHVFSCIDPLVFWNDKRHKLYLNPHDKVIPYKRTLDSFWLVKADWFWTFGNTLEYNKHFLNSEDIEKVLTV